MQLNVLLADRRVLILALVLVLALGVIFIKGLSFGIEFEGGVRIPITFDQDLTPVQMEEVANVIKTRVSKFGLSQVVVRPLPPREIQVELAKGDESSIRQVEAILQQQGNFEAYINGKQAITGQDILPGSIGEGRLTALARDAYRWEVDFAVSEAGANRFAAVALGQGNKPVHMFLDKPNNALVLVEPRHFPKDAEIVDILSSFSALSTLEGANMRIMIIDDWQAKKAAVNDALAQNPNITVILSANSSFYDDVAALTSKVIAVHDKEMEFELYPNQKTGEYYISRWPAVGLLTAPILSEDLAKGKPSRLVSVSGTAPTTEEAAQHSKEIRSILSGGRLPVNAIIGSTVSIPAPLGKQFLEISMLGAAVAFVLIILFITLRYMEPRLFLPIIVVSVAELVLLVAIIGGFGTIDFAAMAGIIAAMGVSIDSQIIITDEVFRRGEHAASRDELKLRVKNAFYIITRNVVIAVVTMLPLFFSGVVEIVGFATSTILGAVLGLLISRPAYAAIVESL